MNKYWEGGPEVNKKGREMNLGNSGAKNSMPVSNSGSSWKSSGDGVVSDQFPAGLRVLVVDDDPTCLRILEKMLINCLYQVTKCNKAETALNLLRENTKGYDIVISDVHMPDVDGFKLLEQVGLEMDLPVIMMSADDSKHVVMKGVTHGACDYLIKPVRIEALKNIWQHVVRKRKHEWKDKDFEQSGSVEEGVGDRQVKTAQEEVDYSSSANEGNWKNSRKRKEEDDETEDKDESSSLKKPRVVWSVELHQQFVHAVNQLGIDKAVPKKILELMNVPGLTRENVASHLQKYRLYLRRISGVATHPNGHAFMGTQEPTFGSMPSLGGLDPLQAFASTGQIPAQSLASIQALGRPTARPHLSIPVADQRNLFSFDNPKLRFGETQQQLSGSSRQINLLHGIPTNMEPKQLANLNHSAQSYGGITMQMPRGHMLHENKAGLVSKLQPSARQPPVLGNNGMSSAAILPRNSITVDNNVRGGIYSPISQPPSLADFSVNNNNTEMTGGNFAQNGSNSGISSVTEVNSEVKGSRGGYLHGYDSFSDLQQQHNKGGVQDWGLPNVGNAFDSQGSLDAVIPASSLVHPGFSSSSQKNRNTASVDDTIFPSENNVTAPNSFSHQFNSFMGDNSSLRVKSEQLLDMSCHNNNLFHQQFGQDDLMSALLQPQEGIGAMENEFSYNEYQLDDLPV